MATAARTEKLDLRLTPAAKRALQQAAAIKNQSVTDFVMESALTQAELILPDQTRFVIDAESWEKLQEMLDAPPRDLPRLAKLLREPSMFVND